MSHWPCLHEPIWLRRIEFLQNSDARGPQGNCGRNSGGIRHQHYSGVQIDGHPWNHKKALRVYEAIHFNKRKPLRKRLPARVKNPLVTPDQENVTWSMDFVTDVLQSNRKFRVLNVIDDSDRVAVAQKVAHSIPASRLIRFMEEIIWEKGKPTNIRAITVRNSFHMNFRLVRWKRNQNFVHAARVFDSEQLHRTI